MFTWILQLNPTCLPQFENVEFSKPNVNLKTITTSKFLKHGNLTSTISWENRIFETKQDHDNIDFEALIQESGRPFPAFKDGDWVAIIFTDLKKVVMGPVSWDTQGYVLRSYRLTINQKIIGYVPQSLNSEKYLKEKNIIDKAFIRESKSQTSEEHEVYLEQICKNVFSFLQHHGNMNERHYLCKLQDLLKSSLEKTYITQEKYNTLTKKIREALK